MIIAIILLLISFFLDGFISNYLSFTIIDMTYFKTIYTIVTLAILFPYFNNYKKYLFLIIIFGLLFDIVYTNTFLLNIVIFLILFYLNKILNNHFPNTFISMIIISLINIFTYYTITYLILMIVNYNDYNIVLLLKILLKNISMTILYSLIIYFVTKYLHQKFNVNQIR